MQHSKTFLDIVNETRPRVKELTLDEAKAKLSQNTGVILMDVREDSEWQKGHAAEAMHLGKGVLERDLETKVPNPETEIIMYCGGGFRSILSADAAQRMGYQKVYSLIGGYRSLTEAGWPMKA